MEEIMETMTDTLYRKRKELNIASNRSHQQLNEKQKH